MKNYIKILNAFMTHVRILHVFLIYDVGRNNYFDSNALVVRKD